MMKIDNEIGSAVLMRMEFARQDIAGVIEKYGDVLDTGTRDDNEIFDRLVWLYESLTDFERDLVIDNPDLAEYAPSDVI